jgi:hypothetical protein
VLDSKDHFIHYVDRNYFFKNDKPICKKFDNHVSSNLYINIGLRKSMNHFNNDVLIINDSEFISDKNNNTYNNIVPITPFVFKTQYVIDMINSVTKKTSMDFGIIFMTNKFNEFFLYYSYIISLNKQNEVYILDYHREKFEYNMEVGLYLNKDFLALVYNKNICCIGLFRDAHLRSNDDKQLLINFYKQFFNESQLIHLRKFLLI